MSVFSELREQYRDKLAAAGLDQATTDPAANVPFVLVDAITVARPAGVGGWDGTLAVRLVTGPPGDGAALAALEDWLQVVLTTLPSPTSAVPDTYGPRELPAYTVTYPVTVPNPNC